MLVDSREWARRQSLYTQPVTPADSQQPESERSRSAARERRGKALSLVVGRAQVGNTHTHTILMALRCGVISMGKGGNF